MGQRKIQVINEKDGTVHHLPGRDWMYLIGPVNGAAKNLTFGLAEFPPDSTAGSHRHDIQEEVIYILQGEGSIIASGEAWPLAPGVAVFIPPGLEHRITVNGDESLRLVTVFSPPVIPGSYDPSGAK